MFRHHSLIAAIACVALVSGSATALADPGNGKGQGNAKGNSQNSEHGNQGNKGNKSGGNGRTMAQASMGKRSWHCWRVSGLLEPGPALPPGIQKNLARGKPLPPGIAKKLDNRLIGRLPHYDGYEWQQAGTDLILVAIASGIIYEVLNGAFD